MTSPLSVILTHGYGDSASAWDGQLGALQSSAAIGTTITWDLPGHGSRRCSQPDQCKMAATVDELAAMARAVPRPLLVGHSAGGYLTLRCAAARDIDAAGLVLISTGPGFRRPAEMEKWNRSMERFAAAAGMPSYTVDLVTMTDSVVVDRTDQIRMPVLVVTGGQDRPAYVAGMHYLARKLPKATLTVIESAGHDPHRTHPDAVNEAILEFAGRISETNPIAAE